MPQHGSFLQRVGLVGELLVATCAVARRWCRRDQAAERQAPGATKGAQRLEEVKGSCVSGRQGVFALCPRSLLDEELAVVGCSGGTKAVSAIAI